MSEEKSEKAVDYSSGTDIRKSSSEDCDTQRSEMEFYAN